MHMAASTIRQYYEQHVVPKWPKPLPKLTAVEAERAARRLYRFVFKKKCPYPVKVTSGRNYSYIRGNTLRVNPDKGWDELVHTLSHSFHPRLSSAKPHSYPHARLEKEMVEYAVAQGWLDGKLQPKASDKPKPTAQEVRYQRTLESIDRWESKLKRAENALKKLTAKRKYYERALQKD
jgi:hypothetical protein